MKENKEISALLHLIDDPDEFVYTAISNKIISIGKEIIPNLENLWETTADTVVHERIELIIHRLQFTDLINELKDWVAGNTNLLQGTLIIVKFFYPNFEETILLKEIEKLRRNIWLELNNYLTPLEQITVLSSIIYNYNKQTGVLFNYTNIDEFLINKTLENKKGNALSNGIIYLILCQLLDVPINAINIPNQFILAYFDTEFNFLNTVSHSAQKIKFFIDPLNGQVHSHADIDAYFKRINKENNPTFYRQMNNKKIIFFLITELIKCYNDNVDIDKKNELIQLAEIVK